MNDKLFEPYYKLGFNHFINKKLMRLKKPKKEIQVFYLGLITVILSLALIIG